MARKLIRLVGPLLFLLILSRMDLGRLADTIASVKLPFLVAALLLYPCLILMKAWRWQMLLIQQRINYGLGPAFLAYNASLSAGYVTPGRLGEFMKALYPHQDEGAPLGQTLSSAFVDRLFDLYLLLMTASLGIAIFSLPGQLSRIVLVILLAVGLTPLLILIPDVSRRAGALVIKGWSLLMGAGREEQVSQALGDFQQGAEQLLSIRLAFPLLVTVLAYAVFYLQCYLTALALRLPLSYPYAAFCVSLASLLALLPVSVSGLGVRDAAFIVLLQPLGATAELAVSYALLILLVFNIFGAGWGAIAWLAKPLK